MSGSPAKITPADYEVVRSLATTEAVVERFGVSLSTAHKHRKRAAAERAPAESPAPEPADAARQEGEPPRRQHAKAQPERSRLEPRDSAAKRTSGRFDVGGVPIFPNTPEGNAERFAYYEAHKLDNQNAWLDYHDVIHGRETPAERRVREQSASNRR